MVGRVADQKVDINFVKISLQIILCIQILFCLYLDHCNVIIV